MLMGTAIIATACHQKEEYPSVPEVTEPQPTGEIIPTVDRQKELKDARKKYADAVAWLYMPGTEVDDPVVQAKDNAYYLQKDENGNYSEWGCYYAHCDNRLSSRSKLDRNTVIFGHSASNCDPDGPKLTKLHRYMDADYVKENPYIYSSMISSRSCLKQFLLFVRHGDTKLLFIPADQFLLFLSVQGEVSHLVCLILLYQNSSRILISL